ncbi:cytochrome P450 [Variovorax sp. ZT4R33]|uniref:cytochrome P450 n=1 Tax=Variovorax sp. ZT4R33 TaxID=3443743 RepID=UPI003F45F5FC
MTPSTAPSADLLPDPVAAATQPDPYPGYARWRAAAPLVFDPRCGLWVASRAEVVQALLAHPQLRVRPPGETVPRALAGRSAGAVFGQLVRMNDGPLHARFKPLLAQCLARLSTPMLQQAARAALRCLPPMPLNDWLFALPLCTLAHALGFDARAATAAAEEGRAFAAGISPLATPDPRDAASAAAEALSDRLGRLLQDGPVDGPLAGWPELDAEARETVLANLVGLFSQACDGTAGLVGLGLLALARAPGLAAQLRADPAAFAPFVAEVARHDPPIQNTRRYVATAGALHGAVLAPGDGVLLLLGAAQRDATLDPAPDDFRLARSERHLLGFGHGAHACPGRAAALAIAASALHHLIDRGLEPATLANGGWGFHASVNARIPFFHTGATP